MRLTALPSALAAIVFCATSSSVSAQQVGRASNSVTLFAGGVIANEWEHVFTPTDLRFRDTYLAGLGISHRFATLFDKLDFEVLGQTALHFGHAHQWEFDAAAVARWTSFPWNDVVRTSFAFGVGPSYETQTPAEEIALHGESAQWLGFWMAEITVGPPESAWSGVLRLHHRSTTFGLFGKNGGSNWLALGIRREF